MVASIRFIDDPKFGADILGQPRERPQLGGQRVGGVEGAGYFFLLGTG